MEKEYGGPLCDASRSDTLSWRTLVPTGRFSFRGKKHKENVYHVNRVNESLRRKFMNHSKSTHTGSDSVFFLNGYFLSGSPKVLQNDLQYDLYVSVSVCLCVPG